MNDLSDLLRPDAMFINMVVSNKKTLLQTLGTSAAPLVGLEPRAVIDRLADREKLGSTGFGGGVGLPHAKLPGLTQVTGLFARLAQPIDYQAVDDLPVDLVFLLLSPTEAGAEHLKALARVSRRMRDRTFLGKLRGAGSRDALYILFATDETRDAA